MRSTIPEATRRLRRPPRWFPAKQPPLRWPPPRTPAERMRPEWP
ncbi:MAG: hypothetical protein EA424_00375 [Planctomycetaceae bacterium]|nr:MAG: hypothetical protein EA424_00375 [Planctomycetaceae bacterium]